MRRAGFFAGVVRFLRRCIYRLCPSKRTMALPPASMNITPEHFMVFGGIIHGFARIEGIMIATMAAISGVDAALLAILMRALGYEQKRDALYSYFELFETKQEHQGPIRAFLDEVHQYAPIRNHIAHSYWVPGQRPNSFKPASMKVRGGKGKVYGLNETETDYTTLELAAACDKLRVIHNSLLAFLAGQGLLSDMDENTLATMLDTSLSDGVEAK
jgi:hypothetical protein